MSKLGMVSLLFGSSELGAGLGGPRVNSLWSIRGVRAGFYNVGALPPSDWATRCAERLALGTLRFPGAILAANDWIPDATELLVPELVAVWAVGSAPAVCAVADDNPLAPERPEVAETACPVAEPLPDELLPEVVVGAPRSVDKV